MHLTGRAQCWDSVRHNAPMPARRRPKILTPAAPELSDVERFALAVRTTEKAKRDHEQAVRDERRRAEQAAIAAAEHAAALEAARRDLDRAIEAVKAAKRSGRSSSDADGAWRAAKARVIELETGEAPSWAPRTAVEAVDDTDESTGADTDTGTDTGDS